MHSGAIKNGHSPGFISPILISLVMHAAFIAAVTIASKTNISENYRPNYVTVEFAEAPAITPEPMAAASPEAEKPIEAPQPDAVRIPDETQKAKEKPKTPDTSAKLMERLKKIEKNVEKKKSEERVAKRIAALEDKAKAAPKKPQGAASTPAAGAPKEISDDKEAKDYYDKVAAMVKAAWTYPGDAPEDLAVVFKIIIAPSGELVDIITEKRSGDSIFDTSAIKAVKKAAPFPQPPKLKGGKNFEVGFRFCPKGCK